MLKSVNSIGDLPASIKQCVEETVAVLKLVLIYRRVGVACFGFRCTGIFKVNCASYFQLILNKTTIKMEFPKC